jgi:hypothetical protein
MNAGPTLSLTHRKLGAFTVGLVDGVGAIQVNQRRQRSLEFRLLVKLPTEPGNGAVLRDIAGTYGGYVAYGKETVHWMVNCPKTIDERIVPLLETYPPLTSLKRVQLAFLKKCLHEQTVTRYLSARFEKAAALLPESIVLAQELRGQKGLEGRPEEEEGDGGGTWAVPSYFGDWLRGYIGARGCFSGGGGEPKSFSISQNSDRALVELIRDYFHECGPSGERLGGDGFWPEYLRGSPNRPDELAEMLSARSTLEEKQQKTRGGEKDKLVDYSVELASQLAYRRVLYHCRGEVGLRSVRRMMEEVCMQCKKKSIVIADMIFETSLTSQRITTTGKATKIKDEGEKTREK